MALGIYRDVVNNQEVPTTNRPTAMFNKFSKSSRVLCK